MQDHALTARMSAAVSTLILLILASLAVSQSVTLISRSPGLDFYQFWGVPTVMALTDHAVGPPYRNGRRYVETLRAYVAGVNDAKLRAAQSFWGGPDFAGTPLLYFAFSAAPRGYTVAVSTFQALQVILFVGAVLLLGRLHRLDPFAALCLALLCVLFYNPLLSDVRVANLGCVQVVYLTGLLFLAAVIERTPSWLRRAALGAAFLAALAALTLCKPSVVLIGALLTIHLGVRHGPGLLVGSALPAAAVAALLLALSSAYFGSWGVWRQWYDFVYGANPHMLVRSVTSGNFATAVIVAGWLGLDVYTVSAAALGLLVLSLLIVVWSRAGDDPATSRGRAALAALTRLVASPSAAVAVGIVLTLATSPLFWLHYYVLVLIPGLWLLSGPSSSRALPWLGAAAVAMSSGMLDSVFRPLQWLQAIPASIALSWLPLWAGILLHAIAPAADTAPAPVPNLRDDAPTRKRPSRRRKR